ncbi:MAG: fimbrillin family protein [Prevotellaceae bacterium]|jgi:hypothetical protein|nr:fimbrillin family protein [Prevotellaceae bacterium]
MITNNLLFKERTLRGIRNLRGLRSVSLLNSLLSLAAILCFAACSQDDEPFNNSADPVAVRFSTAALTVAPATRTTDQGSRWAADDNIGVYMLEHGATLAASTPGPCTDGNNRYIATAAGSTGVAFRADALADSLWYPHDGSAVDFIAYYPYQATVSDYKADVETPANQSAYGDPLWAKVTKSGNGYTKSDKAMPIDLPFVHVLSKLDIALTAGAGTNSTDLTGATVTVKGVYNKGTLNLEDGSVAVNGTSTADIASQSVSGKYEAVIIPQTCSAGAYLEITLPAVTKTYRQDLSGIVFASGMKSAFTLALNGDATLTVVTAGITAWNASGSAGTTNGSPRSDIIDIVTDFFNGLGWAYGNNVFTVRGDGNYTFTGSTIVSRIVVQDGVTAHITLKDVSISNATAEALNIGSEANVRLSLEGTNYLSSTKNMDAWWLHGGAGIQNNGSLTIDGSGILYASGNDGNAGINNTNGTLKIAGGTVIIKPSPRGGYGHASAIGAGYDWYNPVSGGTMELTGGTIIANGRIGGYYRTGDATTEMTLGSHAVILASGAVDGYTQTANDAIMADGEVAVDIDAKTLTLQANMTIPTGATLTVPEGWTLTIGAHTLTNNGTIIKKGTISGTVLGNQPQS